MASARQKPSKHQIILQLNLPETTIKSCKDLRDQFYQAKEGILQFTNPDVFTVVIADTSLSNTEVNTVEEILAEFQENLPQDIKIGGTDCMEGDKVQQEDLNILIESVQVSKVRAWVADPHDRLQTMVGGIMNRCLQHNMATIMCDAGCPI